MTEVSDRITHERCMAQGAHKFLSPTSVYDGKNDRHLVITVCMSCGEHIVVDPAEEVSA